MTDAATDETVIYPARRVITMNPGYPHGEAVAVRGDRILGVGTVEELAAWGEHRIDDTFADNPSCPAINRNYLCVLRSSHTHERDYIPRSSRTAATSSRLRRHNEINATFCQNFP